MDTTQFDYDIQEAKAQKEALNNTLERFVDAYIEIAARLLAIEMPTIIERAVANNPAITRNLGLEKLRELKGKVKNVLDKLPALTREELSSNEAWEHRQALPDTNMPVVRGALTNKVETGLRRVIGHIGELLIKYGYYPEVSSAWDVQRNKSPLYTGDEFQQTFAEYRKMKIEYEQLMEQLVDSHQNIGRLQKAKERAIAKDLWDQA